VLLHGRSGHVPVCVYAFDLMELRWFPATGTAQASAGLAQDQNGGLAYRDGGPILSSKRASQSERRRKSVVGYPRQGRVSARRARRRTPPPLERELTWPQLRQLVRQVQRNN
jgi:hypothetical protein